MRARLIGQYIWHDTALYHFRQHVRAIANQSDRKRLSIFARSLEHFQRFIE
jgi:hypothetical protein